MIIYDRYNSDQDNIKIVVVQTQMNTYQPFEYPPDFALAQTHKQATKPGKLIKKNQKCPCCQTPMKQQIQSWFTRSIDHDFKIYGGAVVTYFWLVKLYAFVCLFVLLVYSSYLIVNTHNMCSLTKDYEGQLKCERFLGIAIATNQILVEIMDKFSEQEAKTRILTLRTITFVILIVGNLMALYTSGRFKRRYPQQKDISTFSLIFKNTKKNLNELSAQLKQQFPDVRIKEMLRIKTMQPFYTDYKNKLQVYYQCKIQQKPKKKLNLMKLLEKLDGKCNKEEQLYMNDSDRVIVVFHREVDRNQVKAMYELKGMERFKFQIGIGGRPHQFCQDCPTTEEIIWNNIGSDQSQKIRLKVLSVVYFFLLIAGSYLFLSFCMHLVYDRDVLPSPYNVIVANIVMTIMVPIALTFRQLMNKLSQMRRPNTQTSRTMFIVLTTVLFHFIYYILIPSFYLYFSKKVEKNKVLTIVTNQTFNFLLVQFILAYIDFIFCQWNKRLKKVEDEEKPIGCQKILHSYIEYPRFPIQFKLIILFKTYSFIILFAFQSPFLMFLCFGLLVFVYICDKFSVYRHYRMQIIDNKVQYRFLKIYSVFFSVYTLLIYALTQKFQDLSIQFYAAIGFTAVAILIQLFVIKDQVFEDETIMPSTIEEENIKDSYTDIFNKFKQDITNERVDLQIKQFLLKEGYGSLQTEDQMGKERLIKSK